MEKLLETPHDPGSTAEYNWEELKSCVLKAGEETDRRRKLSLTGFQITLHPLIEAKNRDQSDD